MQKKGNNPNKEEFRLSIKTLSYSKQKKFEYDIEYKLLIDAWKIITKNKIFKTDLLDPSLRVLIFYLSVLGIYNENLNQVLMKKEFPFLCEPSEINRESI